MADKLFIAISSFMIDRDFVLTVLRMLIRVSSPSLLRRGTLHGNLRGLLYN